MFQEEEPGKPQNWCFTVTVIITISLVNVAIFVVLRVLLDSENEFDESIVQGMYFYELAVADKFESLYAGKLREDLTQFLGIFSLSFCFGCWCCFCCTGKCFTCLAFLNPRKWKLGHLWSRFVGHEFAQKTKQRMQTLKRKGAKQEEHLAMDEFSMAENGRPIRKDQNGTKSNLAAGAGTTIKSSTDNMSQTDSSEFEGIDRKISPPFGGSNYGGDAETGNAGERRTRPSTLLTTPAPIDIAKNKRNRGERQQFSMERVRRWSMAPVSSDVLVKMGGGGKAMEKGKFRENGSSSSGSSAGRKQSVVAVRGIDFVQIPVQMLTPSTIAIVDRGKLNHAYEAEDGTPSPVSPKLNKMSPKRKITQ